MQQSIWSREISIPGRPTLPGGQTADVAVIGAGLAGILTAHFLQERGARVIVLEAGRIGGGQTKNTTAKITCQHNLIYASLIEAFGLAAAQQYAAANQAALNAYRALIEARHIACDYEEQPSFVYALDQTDALERELDAARRLNLPARLAGRTGLPFPVAGALRFDGQAQFNPLAFLRAVAEPLTIYENTAVRAVERHTVRTDRGDVEAAHIVVAAHYPFINVPGFYFLRMHQQRSYVIALENAAAVDGMYIDAAEGGYSFRNYGDLLLLGGGGHRTGENSTGGRYAALRQAAASFFPGYREIAHWSAQDCMTIDGVPYIGRYCLTTPHLYVATGFRKWGMTTAMAAAKILADLIECGHSDYAAVFSPQRFRLSASAKALAENTAAAFQGLSREFFRPPDALLADLPAGHGGVVEYDGKKVGVYKSNDRCTHIVSTRCPHLGCQLEWNPDELSWDCPCHGSRFDYRGKRLCGPALSDLPYCGQANPAADEI